MPTPKKPRPGKNHVHAQEPKELNAAALEASLPSLTDKLRELTKDLTESERQVFSSIVNSAALHLETIQAVGHTAEISYAKPISAVATVGVRQALMEMPATLRLNR
ncbi:MAG TPA: hypothetical protein VF006_18425 [Longimicrobium sp.]